eukprot:1128237_1
MEKEDQCWKCNKLLDSAHRFKCETTKCEHIFCGRHYMGCAHDCSIYSVEDISWNMQSHCDNNHEDDDSDDTDTFHNIDHLTFEASESLLKYVEQCSSNAIELQVVGVQGIENLLSMQQISPEAIFHTQVTSQLLNIVCNTTDEGVILDIMFILCEITEIAHLNPFVADTPRDTLLDQGVIPILLHLFFKHKAFSELHTYIMICLNGHSDGFIDALIEQEPMDIFNTFLDQCLEMEDELEQDGLLTNLSQIVTNMIARVDFPNQMTSNQVQECFKMMRAARELLSKTSNRDIVHEICGMYANITSITYNGRCMILEFIQMERTLQMKVCYGVGILDIVHELTHTIANVMKWWDEDDIKHLMFDRGLLST